MKGASRHWHHGSWRGPDGVIGENEEVDLTGPDVVSIHVGRIGQDVGQRVLVPHQVVELGEGRLWELDHELMGGLTHGDRLSGRRAGRWGIRSSACECTGQRHVSAPDSGMSGHS